MSAIFKWGFYFNDKINGEMVVAPSSFFPSCLMANRGVLLPSSAQLADGTYNEISFTGNYDFLITSANNGNTKIFLTYPNGTKTTISNSNRVVWLPGGTYTLEYFFFEYEQEDGTAAGNHYKFTYIFNTATNHLPLKPWTVAAVVDRILDLAEPLFGDEKPRYQLAPDQREWLEGIQAPEFTMTRCTLREQLRVVGGYIHAEPRLVVKRTAQEDGTETEEFLIYFDRLGQWEQNTSLVGKPYVGRVKKQDINQYATGLDTTASNIVNQLSYAQGTIVSPSAKDYLSMRTDSINVRVTDTNAIAYTDFPIHSVIKVMVSILDEGSTSDFKYKDIDITPYIFEKHAYDSNLSSYDGTYPYAKAYAVYYEIGQKNLGGFFFKEEDNVSPVFKNYAIANILSSVTGTEASEFQKLLEKNPASLCVRVTYVPIYSTRFAHGKAFDPQDIQYEQVYNQSENLIETRYYGENVKGAAYRLGNFEEERTYYLAFMDDVPKAGQLIGDMAISGVSVSVMPTFIKCTVALTKDFNRISQYVGISSNKRIYEISERQAYARDILLREYCVIKVQDGDAQPDDVNTLFRNMDDIFSAFFASTGRGRVDRVFSKILNANGSQVGSIVQLPVVSSAFGNVATYSWTYKDNYSAGATINRSDTANDEAYDWWQTDVPYGDYYGRGWKCDFEIPYSNDDTEATVTGLPSVMEYPTLTSPFLTTSYTGPYILRKDSREALNFNVQLEFVTEEGDDLIIGSGLASNLSSIGGSATINENAWFVVLDTPINKFQNAVTDYVEKIKLTTKQTSYSRFIIPTPKKSGVAWAIITPIVVAQTEYEDETGTISTITEYKGGEILVAKNQAVTEGETLGYVTFTIKHQIHSK